MDCSWLISLGHCRLLIDPWLEGPEIDVAGWFNSQWHATVPLDYAALPAFDAVLITQQYADHCHLATLKRLQPAHILAPIAVARVLRKALPDSRLTLFDRDRRQFQLRGVTVEQWPSERRFAPFYHSYRIYDADQQVLLANHGHTLSTAEHEMMAAGGIDVLLSPFNSYRLPSLFGGEVAPGLPGLKALLASTQPRTVIPTHDEIKPGRGLIPRLARIEAFEPEDATRHPWLNQRFMAIDHYRPVAL